MQKSENKPLETFGICRDSRAAKRLGSSSKKLKKARSAETVNLSRVAKRLVEKKMVKARCAETGNLSRVAKRLVEKKIVGARSAETVDLSRVAQRLVWENLANPNRTNAIEET